MLAKETVVCGSGSGKMGGGGCIGVWLVAV